MSDGQKRAPPASETTRKVVPLRDLSLQQAVSGILNRPEDDVRPVLLFLAGCNGSGKSTLFAQLDAQAGRTFTFVNADLIASLLQTVPARDKVAQKIADLLRTHLVAERSSFATETVFSDEVGAKLQFLRDAEAAGFHVVMMYVALANVHLSRERVAFRVQEQQGHDVPPDRLQRRFIASRENCRRALNFVESAIVLDNSSLRSPFRVMAVVQRGRLAYQLERCPAYVHELLPTGPLARPAADRAA